MNGKIPFLTRQMVYAFLLGLILGGVIMATVDAYARVPLFSKAFAPGDNTRYDSNWMFWTMNPGAGLPNSYPTHYQGGGSGNSTPPTPVDPYFKSREGRGMMMDQ